MRKRDLNDRDNKKKGVKGGKFHKKKNFRSNGQPQSNNQSSNSNANGSNIPYNQ